MPTRQACRRRCRQTCGRCRAPTAAPTTQPAYDCTQRRGRHVPCWNFQRSEMHGAFSAARDLVRRGRARPAACEYRRDRSKDGCGGLIEVVGARKRRLFQARCRPKKKMVGAAARFESNSLEGACFAPRRVYIRHTRRADIEPIQRGVHGRQARGVVGTSGCRIGCLQSNKKNQKGLVRSGRLG